ncbi:hypothetical protein C8F04DRAFT_1181831 [Mycena alexandri]|uniref:Uncharacterized protein n=1 Tax=Mycena alexandri TaxID=1745969 RepID=A0AAD6SYL9_9AGAR|nr:hypothetical protein C8F04DRAFT_1181831 [Mycena alexandri]
MPPALRVPPAIAALGPPPPDFIPCRLYEIFGANFTNHAEFSRQGNKTYWVLFSWAREAVYTLKPDCLAGKELEDDERDVVASIAEWAEVLRVWAAFCYHKHAKCEHHAHACGRSTCPGHPRPEKPPAPSTRRDPRVKVEVKVEVGLGVKRERVTPKLERTTPRLETRSTPATKTSKRRAPVSYTPVPQSPSNDDSDDDIVEPGGVPLWAPDTPPPPPARPLVPVQEELPVASVGSKRGVSAVEDVDDATHARSRHAAPSRAPSTSATSAPTSTTLSSTSSLSASTTEAPDTAAKGKARAISTVLSASSISRAAYAGQSPAPAVLSRLSRAGGSAASCPASPRIGTPSTVASTSRLVRRNDPFFVSAAGLIRDTSAAAFADIREGPVKVVVGWEAATRASLAPDISFDQNHPSHPSCKMPKVRSRVDQEKRRLLESHLPNFLEAVAEGRGQQFFAWVQGYYRHRFGVASLHRAWVPADTDSTLVFSAEELAARAELHKSINRVSGFQGAGLAPAASCTGMIFLSDGTFTGLRWRKRDATSLRFLLDIHSEAVIIFVAEEI